MNQSLRFHGGEAEAHQLRADELVRVVQHLQQIALLLAANRLGIAFKHRFRPTTELREQVQLVFGVPQAGSYAMPWAVNDARGRPTLPLELSPGDIESDISGLFQAVATGDDEWFNNNVPDSRFERKLLDELDKLLPAAGSPFEIELSSPTISTRLTASARHQVYAWQERISEEPEQVRQTYTGQLIEMKFDRRVITVSDPVHKREVECFYAEDIEPMLTTSRRQFVQITGVFTVGADGFPIRVTDVSRIEPLNLDQIHIGEIQLDGESVVLQRDLIFDPILDPETGQLLIVSDESFGLHASGSTRSELVAEIEETLSFLYAEYALADVATLTPDAALIRRNLRAAVGEH